MSDSNKPAGTPSGARHVTRTPEQLVGEATAWWHTSIIDIQPGQIGIRGYAIQDLIGKLSFPEMIWLMLRGERIDPAQGKLLEAALVSAVDHGPHAPSIAISRMAVSCGLPINGAMASAINALDDVHGGAGQQCMALYQDIDARAEGGVPTDAHVDAALDAYVAEQGKVVAGFGHRFHPIDPRAVKLMQMVQEAQGRGEVSGRFGRIGAMVEAALARRTGKRIPMNIDGITAVIYCELGLPPELGRGLFILSRSVGILAHAWEQTEQGHRIKGPMPPTIPYTYTGHAPRKLED